MSKAGEEAMAKIAIIINRAVDSIIDVDQLDEDQIAEVMDSATHSLSVLREEVAFSDESNEDFSIIIATVEMMGAMMISNPLNTALINGKDEVIPPSFINMTNIENFQRFMEEEDIPAGYEGTLNLDFYDHGFYGHRIDLYGIEGK